MKRNNENLLKLEMGMSKEDVLAVMGKPILNEAYQSLQGRSVVIYFYYTQRKWADGNYTKDECTPVVIENGKLVGWGDEFYKSKMEIDVNIKQK
jgi:outer membrane protein assembly factor BamE (lipoprotein component of BamABCDE complex)